VLTPLEGEGAWGLRRGYSWVIRRVGADTSAIVYEQFVSLINSFRFDINNRAAIRRGNIYSCIIIIYTCCDMCSSCKVDYFVCVPSNRIVCTFDLLSSGLCPRKAQAPLSPRSLWQRWPHRDGDSRTLSRPWWAFQCPWLFTAKWVKAASVQGVAPRPPGGHAGEAPLYLQRWHWQGPQWGSWAFQCAAWHSGVQYRAVLMPVAERQPWHVRLASGAPRAAHARRSFRASIA